MACPLNMSFKQVVQRGHFTVAPAPDSAAHRQLPDNRADIREGYYLPDGLTFSGQQQQHPCSVCFTALLQHIHAHPQAVQVQPGQRQAPKPRGESCGRPQQHRLAVMIGHGTVLACIVRTDAVVQDCHDPLI
jgi:hypothetical protein